MYPGPPIFPLPEFFHSFGEGGGDFQDDFTALGREKVGVLAELFFGLFFPFQTLLVDLSPGDPQFLSRPVHGVFP